MKRTATGDVVWPRWCAYLFGGRFLQRDGYGFGWRPSLWRTFQRWRRMGHRGESFLAFARFGDTYASVPIMRSSAGDGHGGDLGTDTPATDGPRNARSQEKEFSIVKPDTRTPESRILAILPSQSVMPQNKIVEEVHMTQARVISTLARLVELGLVERMQLHRSGSAGRAPVFFRRTKTRMAAHDPISTVPIHSGSQVGAVPAERL